ncbi:MAG: hypothetical protein CVU44_00265 [Chloroflexi bacterium HGW-Chloroflexi-6]|nr:MAG: hypothetical protein CVU44_00265 [Chloroflexi bacterium HGW-Chloroflexi-6]
MYLFSELSPLPFAIILLLWALGGWLIAARLFKTAPHERGLLGLGLGLILSNWAANGLARLMPPLAAFWLSALLLLGLGLSFAWFLQPKERRTLRQVVSEIFPPESLQLRLWLVFGIIFLVFTLIGRGLGIFDDYQNLPPVSTMAAGDIPPQTAFDPRLRFGYHYFQLLLAAQFVNLVQTGPWVALDLARGLAISLTIMLTGLLAYRLTGNKIAAALSAIFVTFTGGARWILLLLPASLLNRLSSGIQMIGSGADSGPNLTITLYKAWKIEGGGPTPFPFLYGSGIDPSLSMAHTGFGSSAILIGLLLILLAENRQSRWANPVLAILLASMALANEVTFAFLYLGLGFTYLLWAWQKRSLRFEPALWGWLGVLFAGGLLSLVQGGMLTELTFSAIERATLGSENSLYRVGFALSAPTVLSAHLGYLSLLNPLHWFAILAELGLAIFALPWVFASLREETRAGRWISAAWLASMIPSILVVFFEYTGNAGPTAISRMIAHFGLVVKIVAVPLLWNWARQRSQETQAGLLIWGLAACLSGFALFGIQMQAMPNPIYAAFLEPIDDKMYRQYWNTLEPDTMVFDANYLRGITVTGRPAIAALNFGTTLPEWDALAANPDPRLLKAAGYDYIYHDLKFANRYGALLQDSCVKLVGEIEETNNSGQVADIRRILQITDCE